MRWKLVNLRFRLEVCFFIEILTFPFTNTLIDVQVDFFLIINEFCQLNNWFSEASWINTPIKFNPKDFPILNLGWNKNKFRNPLYFVQSTNKRKLPGKTINLIKYMTTQHSPLNRYVRKSLSPEPFPVEDSSRRGGFEGTSCFVIKPGTYRKRKGWHKMALR